MVSASCWNYFSRCTVRDHRMVWEILQRCFSLTTLPPHVSSGSRTRDSVPLDSAGKAWDRACCFCRIINKTAFLHRSELRSGAPVCKAEPRATRRKNAYRSFRESLIFKFSPTYLRRLSQPLARDVWCALISRAWITLISLNHVGIVLALKNCTLASVWRLVFF